MGNYRLVFSCYCAQSNVNQNENVFNIQASNQKKNMPLFKQIDDNLTKNLLHIIKDEEIFEKLALSIAPHIYGNLEVKKSLLLMLIGGIQKMTEQNVALRGDINILL